MWPEPRVEVEFSYSLGHISGHGDALVDSTDAAKFLNLRRARVAKLADALDLGSSG